MGRVFNAKLLPLCPWKEPQYPSCRGMFGSHGQYRWVWRIDNDLVPTVFRTQNRPAHSESPCRLRSPAPSKFYCTKIRANYFIVDENFLFYVWSGTRVWTPRPIDDCISYCISVTLYILGSHRALLVVGMFLSIAHVTLPLIKLPCMLGT